jgi:acetoin utilization deacetylase AcuC-like enzyme/GNAT superfamily N-acetyltransferase
MFRIRRIHDDVVPVNREAIEQAHAILRSQLGGLEAHELEAFERRLTEPLDPRFRTVLYVAERRRRVLGFALVHFDRPLGFAYLEYIASDAGVSGRGFGAALYQRLREETAAAGLKGLYFECLPDDPEEVPDPEARAQNAARLRFYEGFGARPLVDVGWETPLSEGQKGLPHLVFDGLGGAPPTGAVMRKVAEAILHRKYPELCPPEYVARVLAAIGDGPVRLRAPRYAKKAASAKHAAAHAAAHARPVHERHPLVVNDRHDIHHVRERGYVESPVRIDRILGQLEASGLFRTVTPKAHGLGPVMAVHDPELVSYLRRACLAVGDGKSVYPYVFPIRNAARPPKELSVRAGYYCIDTFTPINGNAYRAAVRAADCALTAASSLLTGERLAYALVRPPGHHAERRAFGGFCYFNNAAIAAHHLSARGRVAILDVDFHHGNGQQDIFYGRADVLTVSIHGHPNFAYPYFSGFEDEEGLGGGLGFNLNLPLPEKIDAARYTRTLDKALQRIDRFAPDFLVVALGLDTTKGDPTGTWMLTAEDLRNNGRRIGGLEKPTLVVQEGGYRARTLGQNARAFLEGLDEGLRSW